MRYRLLSHQGVVGTGMGLYLSRALGGLGRMVRCEGVLIYLFYTILTYAVFSFPTN